MQFYGIEIMLWEVAKTAVAFFLLFGASIAIADANSNAEAESLSDVEVRYLTQVRCSCQTKYGTCSAIQPTCSGGVVKGCACLSGHGAPSDQPLAMMKRLNTQKRSPLPSSSWASHSLN